MTKIRIKSFFLHKKAPFARSFFPFNTHIGRHSLSIDMLAACEQLFVLCVAFLRSSDKRIVTAHLRRMHIIVFQTKDLFHNVVLCPEIGRAHV